MDELHEGIPQRQPEPTWRYRSDGEGGVEKKLFQHPDDVPDSEGWVDTPAHVNGTPDAVHGDGGASWDDMDWNELRAAYKDRFGKGPRVGMTAQDVIEALEGGA